MRVARVTAEAFGPLVNRHLELAPGMTVVWGHNETGKSSWHAAVYAAVCGMRRAKGPPRKADQEFAARHRPWDQPHWRVAALVELADGRTLEFQQDLDNQVDCAVHDALLGTDVSDTLMHDGSPDGAVLFGLTRQTLGPTAWVRQADILGVLQDPGALQEQLQRAAATGGADETAARALARLQAFHRDHVGSDRRTSTRPLRRALDAVEHARADCETARAEHHAYLALARQRDDAQRAAEQADAHLQAIRAAVARRREEQAERRRARAHELAAQCPDGPPPPSEDDEALREQVADAVRAWQQRPHEPSHLEGPSSSELESELGGLPAMPQGDVEVADEVARAHDAWRQARHALAAHERLDSPTGAESASGADRVPAGVTAGELRATAERLEVPQEDPTPAAVAGSATAVRPDRRRRAGLAVIAAAAGLLGLALLVADLPVPGALLLAGAAAMATAAVRTVPPSARDPHRQAHHALGAAEAERAQARRDSAHAQAERWGLPGDPDLLRRLAWHLEDRDLADHRRRGREDELTRLRSAADSTAAALRAALAQRGAAAGDDLEEAFASYTAACRWRSHDATQARRAHDLEIQLADRRRLEAHQAARQRERDEAERLIHEAARAAGLDPTGLDEDTASLAAKLQRWQRERRERENARQVQREAWQRLDHLLDGASLTDLDTLVERRRQQAAAYAGIAPGELPDDEDDAAALVREREASRNDARQAVATLDGQLTDKAASLAHVAEAEERLAAAEEQLARLRRLDETITTTVEFLTSARDRVHRDIAPRLKQAIERRLPEVTDGRYVEARVDPGSLSVQVRATDGRWRSASRLSHGTAEQVYLLLRVAMAEHLATTDEPVPLLLDDVTVQTDHQRTEAMLTLLHTLSAERQVVLFSQEDEVHGWAQSHLAAPSDALVELDPSAITA